MAKRIHMVEIWDYLRARMSGMVDPSLVSVLPIDLRDIATPETNLNDFCPAVFIWPEMGDLNRRAVSNEYTVPYRFRLVYVMEIADASEWARIKTVECTKIMEALIDNNRFRPDGGLATWPDITLIAPWDNGDIRDTLFAFQINPPEDGLVQAYAANLTAFGIDIAVTVDTKRV